MQSGWKCSGADADNTAHRLGKPLEKQKKSSYGDQCLEEIYLNSRRAAPADLFVKPRVLGEKISVVNES
jgi:hypothetical protein